MAEFGFSGSYVFTESEMFAALLQASEEVLAKDGIARSDVGYIMFYSGLPAGTPSKKVIKQFEYPAWHLAHELGIPNAQTFGLSQQGCSGFLTMIDLAVRLVKDSGKNALCVSADRLPTGSKREVIYNVMSDATSAVLIGDKPKYRIISHYQKQQPYYWDTSAHIDEILAAYFPMAQRAIQEALGEAGLKPDDIAWVVPHNVSLRSWQILSQLVDVPLERIWTANIAKSGHTVSSDHIINLTDMEKAQVIKAGDRLLLFTFGFGATWSVMILERL